MADIISSTTQQFLDIHDITNNFVIMKDGTASVVLAVDAMNFGLLAEEEQDAVMYAYAGLLNSLNYPIQILINSQTKDVTSYLQLLKDQETGATNETIRRRIRQYREFVSNLIHDRNVLDKKFYVVIPANSIELGFAGAKSVLPGQSKFDITAIERSILLEKAQNILDPRRDHLIAQFARIGLFSRQLSTQEIIQLFYVQYNPEAAEGQQIGESSSYASPLVQASIQGSTMNSDYSVPPVAGGSPQPAPTVSQVTLPPEMPSQMAQPAQPSSPIEGMTNVLGQAPSQPAMNATTQPDLTSTQFPVVPATPSIPKEPVMNQSVPAMPSAAPITTQSESPVTPPSSLGNDPGTASAVPTASTTPLPVDEMSIQADLNETIKQLGVTETGTMAVPNSEPMTQSSTESGVNSSVTGPQATTNSGQTNPTGELPPLPEI